MDLMTLLLTQALGYGDGGGGGGDEPTGAINISENGTHDVARYATAVVNVPSAELPTASGEVF